MSSATMTLIGLNNFLEYQEIDLFQGLKLPDGIDKETTVENILFMSSDKELLYPDGSFMVDAISMWSKKWYRTFEKWIKVLSEEYEPLENYDRKEAWSDSASSSESESSSASASDSSAGSTSTLNDTSAFNETDYSKDTSAAEASYNNASSHTTGNASSIKDDFSKHEGRVHGNIGVTTTQHMLQEELDVSRFNIYDEIAIIFIREFCLAL